MIDVFSLVLGAAIFFVGIATSAFSEAVRDLFSEPYHKWKSKREIRKENIETLRSHIDDFCSSWELFKCRYIPSIELEKDLINACREVYSLISKNEGDFRKNNIGKSIKGLCKEFINLTPSNNDRSGWTQDAESQIDVICEDFRKYNEMLEKG